MGLSWAKTYGLIEGLPHLVELVLIVVDDSCYYADVVVRSKKVSMEVLSRAGADSK